MSAVDSQKQISVRIIKPENLGDHDRKLYIFIFGSKVFIQISSERHREEERKKEWVCGVSDTLRQRKKKNSSCRVFSS